MEKKNFNLKNVLDEIDKEACMEIESNQKEIDENYNEVAKKRAGIVKNMWYFMLKKLLGGLKVKVTIYWNDKEIFNYVIPKD